MENYDINLKLYHNDNLSNVIFKQNPASTPKSAFAFVLFKDTRSAALAIESENGVEWLGRTIANCHTCGYRGT